MRATPGLMGTISISRKGRALHKTTATGELCDTGLHRAFHEQGSGLSGNRAFKTGGLQARLQRTVCSQLARIRGQLTVVTTCTWLRVLWHCHSLT
jgi:hypothetical protein